MDRYDFARAFALVLVAVLLVGPAFVHTNRRLQVAARKLAIWLGLAVLVSLVYRLVG